MAETIGFAFATVFAMAIIFLILMIVRPSKYFTSVYATFSMVCWFALGGLTFLAFDENTYVLSYLWYAIGLFVELTGIALTLMMVKADNDAKELQL